MPSDGPILEALKVIITNTGATERAVRDSQAALITALHARASNGDRNAQQSLDSVAGNPLAGYPTPDGGHVPGQAAAAAAGATVPASEGGASTAYGQFNQGPQTGNQGGGNQGGGGGQQTGGSGQGGNQNQQPQNYRQAVVQAMQGQTQPTPYAGMTPNQAATSSGIGIGADIYKALMSVNEDASRYQGMMGGTTRVSGAVELAREKAYAMSTRVRGLTGLTGQEAAQAFADVTSLGYRDEPGSDGLGRTQMLDFFQRNKANMGMNENESFTVAQAMIRNGAVDSAEGLDALSDALRQVSDAAGAAGVNALLARQNFLTMFNGLTAAGAGEGATALAEGQVSSLARYGRSMQNIDTSTQFGEDFQYRAAASAGMSAGRYQNLMRKDPAAAQGIVDKIAGRSIQQMIGQDQVNWIKRRADEAYGGAEGVGNDPELLQQLADDWQDAFQPDMNVYRDVIANTTGVTMDAGQVSKWVVGQVLGINASDTVGGKGKATAGSTVTVSEGGRIMGAGGGAAAPGTANLLSGNAKNQGKGYSGDKAQDAYTDYVKGTGQKGFRDPLIEQVLEKMSGSERASTKVLVDTAKGPRMMSLDEAIRVAPDKIASGSATFFQNGEAKTFQDVTGLDADTNRKTADDSMAAGNVGVAVDDPSILNKAEAAQRRTAEQQGTLATDEQGKYTVGLSEEAKQLLVLVPPKSSTAESAAGATPPDPRGATSEGVRGMNYGGRGR